jgi:hypothetical protein
MVMTTRMVKSDAHRSKCPNQGDVDTRVHRQVAVDVLQGRIDIEYLRTGAHSQHQMLTAHATQPKPPLTCAWSPSSAYSSAMVAISSADVTALCQDSKHTHANHKSSEGTAACPSQIG